AARGRPAWAARATAAGIDRRTAAQSAARQPRSRRAPSHGYRHSNRMQYRRANPLHKGHWAELYATEIGAGREVGDSRRSGWFYWIARGPGTRGRVVGEVSGRSVRHTIGLL